MPYGSGKACNYWELYRVDIEFMVELGVHAYRFSYRVGYFRSQTG